MFAHALLHRVSVICIVTYSTSCLSSTVRQDWTRQRAIACVQTAQTNPQENKAPDLSSPTESVRSFLAAFAVSDLRRAAACVSGAKYTEQTHELEISLKRNPMVLKLKDYKQDVNGDKAMVTITLSGEFVTQIGEPGVTYKPEELKKRLEQLASHPDTISFQKEGADWLIVPTDPHVFAEDLLARKLDAHGAVASLATFLVVPGPFLAGRTAARAAQCRSHLRLLTICALEFSLDHNGTFKFPANTLEPRLLPYLEKYYAGIVKRADSPYENTKANVHALAMLEFRCPDVDEGDHSYQFNTNLEGIDTLALPLIKASKTVLLYEGEKGKLAFRHGGKANVAFLDGTARLVTKEESAALVWKP